MKKLAVFALFLLSASTALAAKGSVTVENKGNHDIEVISFDWDDGVRVVHADYKQAKSGETVTVTCIKGLFQPDSPGCQVTIQDLMTADTLIGITKKDSGTYVFSGTWDHKSCAAEGDWCAENINVTLDPK